MAEVIIPGPGGRIEGRYHKNPNPEASLALILHPHPLEGGTMHNKVTFALYQTFFMKGFTTLRFNFRGIGKSEGVFDNGEGEINDAAAALDWLQMENPRANKSWIAGSAFGAWIAMQLLLQCSKLQAFLAVAPPVHIYNIIESFPVQRLIIPAENDGTINYQKMVRILDDELSQ